MFFDVIVRYFHTYLFWFSIKPRPALILVCIIYIPRMVFRHPFTHARFPKLDAVRYTCVYITGIPLRYQLVLRLTLKIIT